MWAFCKPEDDVTRQALEGIIFTDIASAQELFEKQGQLSHIDLIVEDEADLARIEAACQPGVLAGNGRLAAERHPADDGRFSPEPFRTEPAGACCGHVPDLQHRHIQRCPATAGLWHPAQPGRHRRSALPPDRRAKRFSSVSSEPCWASVWVS